MKTKILLENFGESVRCSLEHGQTRIQENQFLNLAWLCRQDNLPEGIESFTVSREKLSKAIQTFRAINPFQARRGKGLWKNSPFSFRIVEQRGSKSINLTGYLQGYYQDSIEETEAKQLETFTYNKLQQERL